MFYSHEVLTSRDYGVATVWLVATLGAKSAFKKVNRKAIFEVNVPKACNTIAQPDVPMALRLQSNLLYGVSQVYAQQCQYVLVDAQHARNAMNAMIKVVKIAEIDAEISKARPEQLELPDDPAFVPDFPSFPLDLGLEEVLARVASRSQSVSTMSPNRSQHGSGRDGPVGGLILPSDTTDMGDADIFAIRGDDARASSQYAGATSVVKSVEHEGFDPFADFGFDDDGNMIEFGESHPASASARSALYVGSDAAASAQVRLEHEQARQNLSAQSQGLEDALPPIDDGFIPQDVEGFSIDSAGPEPVVQDAPSSDTVVVSSSSSTVSAPLRGRPRKRKTLQLDQKLELRNSELIEWNNNYATYMKKARVAKIQAKAIAQAKKNAAWFAFGRGIGDTGYGIGAHGLNGPLSMFAGESLRALITGNSSDSDSSHKRGRENDASDDDSDQSARRVRQRSEEAEIVRAAEDDLMLPQLDDDIELAREAAPSLGDMSSAMPWNVSASIRGSSIAPGTVMHSGRARSISASVGLMGRGRTVSASPLHGRGTMPPNLPDIEIISDAGGDELPRHSSDAVDPIEYDHFGPAAAVNTQQASNSQWVRDVLDKESSNFLGFIEHGIEQERERVVGGAAGDEEAEATPEEVTFEKLLPPEQNSRIVASQALLHVLSLATKNLIKVRQDEHYGEIGLSLIDAL